ncbi:MAG TPA: response regulator [Nitrospirota bacterium]|nr:response regulator [Nitrospirota bacterium]
MPKAGDGGAILVGSPEAAMRDELAKLVSEGLGRAVVGVSESSDLLLELIGRDVDLVILDTNLGGLPVADTVQIMKKCRPRVPVVVISDDYSVATGSRIMEQGVFYYMYKPVDMGSLLKIIESALKKRAREAAVGP